MLEPNAEAIGDPLAGMAVAERAVHAAHALEGGLVVEQQAGLLDDAIGIGAHQQHGPAFEH
ncbi:hypothetical protein D3C87_2052380 [compost metagenome]